jgi:hypothetical protein
METHLTQQRKTPYSRIHFAQGHAWNVHLQPASSVSFIHASINFFEEFENSSHKLKRRA